MSDQWRGLRYWVIITGLVGTATMLGCAGDKGIVLPPDEIVLPPDAEIIGRGQIPPDSPTTGTEPAPAPSGEIQERAISKPKLAKRYCACNCEGRSGGKMGDKFFSYTSETACLKRNGEACAVQGPDGSWGYGTLNACEGVWIKEQIPESPSGTIAPSGPVPLQPESTAPLGVDLMPVNPQPQFPYCPAFGSDRVTLIVTVRNNSTTHTAPPTVTRLQFTSQTLVFYDKTSPTPGIAPGGSVNVSFPMPINPAPPGDWIVGVKADSGNQVSETNETNNSLTGRCIR